jgi:hypothetical protein
MQKVTYCNPENAPCDQYNLELLRDCAEESWGGDEEVKGGIIQNQS